MTTVGEIMSPDVTSVGVDDTLVDAARLMRELDVGTVPVCGPGRTLRGMISDRDIVVKCLATGGDPARTRAGELTQSRLVTVTAQDDVELALNALALHQVRRLPVVDGHELVGILSTADLARTLSPEQIGELVSMISY